MAEAIKKLPEEIQAEEARVWLLFWTSHRRYLCDANRAMLDEWLTANLKTLTVANLEEAFSALRCQLAVLTSAAADEATDRHHKAEAEGKVESEAAQVENSAPRLPADYDRRRILKMDRDEYKALRAKWGDVAILARVNGMEAQ